MRLLGPVLLLLSACSPGGGPHPLAHLATARIAILGMEFEVWLAETAADRARGLMGITAAQIAPLEDGTERGMLFVFPTDAVVSFFMKETIIPLDLAYATSDGTIVETLDLEPLDLTPRPSNQPVRYALELASGTLAGHSLGAGDVIVIP